MKFSNIKNLSSNTETKNYVFDNADTIGQAITYIKETLNISSSDLSRKANVPRSYISQIENGKRIPTIDVLSKIANALNNTPLSYIFLRAQLLSNNNNTKGKEFASTIVENMEAMVSRLYWFPEEDLVKNEFQSTLIDN